MSVPGTGILATIGLVGSGCVTGCCIVAGFDTVAATGSCMLIVAGVMICIGVAIVVSFVAISWLIAAVVSTVLLVVCTIVVGFVVMIVWSGCGLMDSIGLLIAVSIVLTSCLT
jgi:hypothetical protein